MVFQEVDLENVLSSSPFNRNLSNYCENHQPITIESVRLSEIKVNKYSGEFWTSKQRKAGLL